ncbi:nuclear localization sequence binding protein [Babesia ovis]|uniref:Nuclear localization sequence binding protein n=1 Tax=Babesia ovis TaxID=5869 RepID=A0A9W5TE23_BABOV|nr:nuclear localization sequence binding protein [Babesia ovis]
MIVLEHISTLLGSADADARRKANGFLVKWQQSVEAWQEAHNIIDGSYPAEAKLIAAQTLRTKLMYDFYQLPSESVEKLCEVLMSYLAEPTLPKNIASTLCLAICDLAIQAAEAWTSPLEYFITCYSRGSIGIKMLLSLIECLAEEAGNTRIIVTPDIRNKLLQNMKRDYTKLLDLLIQVRTSGNDLEITSAIFRCWHSWRKLDNFAANAEACNLFIGDCLQVVSKMDKRTDHGIDDDTYEAAVDCIVDVLYEVADLKERIRAESEASGDSLQYLTQTKSDLQQVVRSCFDLCVSDEFNAFLIEAFSTNDRFVLGCFSNLVIAVIDALDFTLLEPQPQLIRLLMLAVHFLELPYCMVFAGFNQGDEPNTINCFSRYYNRMVLREQIAQVVAACNPADINPIDEETTLHVRRTVSLLLNVLYAESPNCQGTKDMCAQLLEIVLFIAIRPGVTGEADNAEYENYVTEVYDVMPLIAKVLQTDEVFETVKKLTIDNGTLAGSHHGLDACFRVVSATVAALDMRKASKHNVTAIASIIEGIETLLRGNIPTGLMEFYCWQSAILFLKDVKRVLMLDETEIVVQRVMGLLCGAYTVAIGNDTPHATKIESTLVNSIANVCYHLRLGRLRNWEPILQQLGLCIQRAGQNRIYSIMLIEGTANAISDLPPETICTIFQQMSDSWIHVLEAVVMNKMAMAAVDVNNLVAKLCALVRNIRAKRILQAFVHERITPLLCKLLTMYLQEPSTVEEICRCLKHSARSIGDDFAVCVHQVVVTVGNVAKERMWSTYLYLVEWLYTLFSPSQPEQLEVKQLYFVLTGITLNILANKGGQMQIHEDPEQIVEDFFGLQTRFVRNSPECFDNDVVFRDIAAASVLCFNMRQPHCVFEFWIALLESDTIISRFRCIATELLPKCVEEVFGVLATGCRTSVERCIEDFIDALVRSFGNEASELLQLGLGKLPIAVVPNERQKSIMIQMLLSDRRHDAIYEVYKLCCQVVMRNRAC